MVGLTRRSSSTQQDHDAVEGCWHHADHVRRGDSTPKGLIHPSNFVARLIPDIASQICDESITQATLIELAHGMSVDGLSQHSCS